MADEFDDKPAGGSMPGFIMPAVTALVALAVGMGIGAAIVYMVVGGKVEKVPVPRDLTDAELRAACAPLVADAIKELDEATGRVEKLVDEVKEKQARVQELETEMARRGERGAALVRELEAAKAEVARLKVELETAIEEKEALVVELKATVEALERTEEKLEVSKEQTRQAKEMAYDNKWDGFVNEAQLAICERGGRKKLGRCRETVIERVAPFEAQFLHCMRSNQEPPMVIEFDKKVETELPRFASWLGEDDKITKDWYVRLCDPTLPEADNLLDEVQPPAGEPTP